MFNDSQIGRIIKSSHESFAIIEDHYFQILFVQDKLFHCRIYIHGKSKIFNGVYNETSKNLMCKNENFISNAVLRSIIELINQIHH